MPSFRERHPKKILWCFRLLVTGALVGAIVLFFGAIYKERMSEWALRGQLEKFGIGDMQIGVRAIAANSAVLGPLTFGEHNEMSADFVRIDYGLSDVRHRRIEKVQVGTMRVELVQTPTGWDIPGLSRLMALRDPTAAPMVIEHTEIQSGLLTLRTPRGVRVLPFSATITSDDGLAFAIDLSLRPNGDAIHLEAAVNQGTGEASATQTGELRLGAQADWLRVLLPEGAVPPMVLNGDLTVALKASVLLNGETPRVTVESCTLTSPRVRVLTTLSSFTLPGVVAPPTADPATTTTAPATGAEADVLVDDFKLVLSLTSQPQDGTVQNLGAHLTAGRLAMELRQATVRWQATVDGVDCTGNVPFSAWAPTGWQADCRMARVVATDGSATVDLGDLHAVVGADSARNLTAPTGTLGFTLTQAAYGDIVAGPGHVDLSGSAKAVTIAIPDLPVNVRGDLAKLRIEVPSLQVNPADWQHSTGDATVHLISATPPGFSLGTGDLSIHLADGNATLSSTPFDVNWQRDNTGRTLRTERTRREVDVIQARVALNTAVLPLADPWAITFNSTIQLLSVRVQGFRIRDEATVVVSRTGNTLGVSARDLQVRYQGTVAATIAEWNLKVTADPKAVFDVAKSPVPDWSTLGATELAMDLHVADVEAATYHVKKVDLTLGQTLEKLSYTVGNLGVDELPGLEIRDLHGEVNAFFPTEAFSVTGQVGITPGALPMPAGMALEGEPSTLKFHVSSAVEEGEVKAQAAINLASNTLQLRMGENHVKVTDVFRVQGNYRKGLIDGNILFQLTDISGLWNGIVLDSAMLKHTFNLQGLPLGILQAGLTGTPPTTPIRGDYGFKGTLQAGATAHRYDATTESDTLKAVANVDANWAVNGTGDQLQGDAKLDVDVPTLRFSESWFTGTNVRFAVGSGTISLNDLLAVLPEWRRMTVDDAWQNLPLSGSLNLGVGKSVPGTKMQLESLRLDLPFRWTAANGFAAPVAVLNPGTGASGAAMPPANDRALPPPGGGGGGGGSDAGAGVSLTTQASTAAPATTPSPIGALPPGSNVPPPPGLLPGVATAALAPALAPGHLVIEGLGWSYFSVEPTDWPIILKGHSVNLEGDFALGYTPVKGKVRTLFEWPDGPHATASVQVHKFPLEGLNDYLTLIKNMGDATLTGFAELDAAVDWSPTRQVGTAHANFDHVDFALPSKKYAVYDMATHITINDIFNMRTAPGQTLTFETAILGPIAFGDVANIKRDADGLRVEKPSATAPPPASTVIVASPAAPTTATVKATAKSPTTRKGAKPVPATVPNGQQLAPVVVTADPVPGVGPLGFKAANRPGGVIKYQIESTENVFLESFDLRFLGGDMQGHAVRVNLNDLNFQITLFGDDIRLNEMLKLVNGMEGDTDAVLYGKLPIVIDQKNGISYRSGFLYIKPGEDGHLSLTNLGPLKSYIEQAGPKIGPLISNALKNFDLQVFKLDFNDDPNDNTKIRMRVIGKGGASDLYEAVPVDLTVNLNGDVIEAINLGAKLAPK